MLFRSPDIDVKKDLDAGIEVMRSKGIQPNALVMSWWLYRKLTNNKLVLAAVKDLFPEASKTGTVTQAMIEAYFDIRLIVAGAIKNTANRAKAAKLEDIWSSEYAMLARVATPGADITEPCIGRIMRWNEGLAGEVITDTYQSVPWRTLRIHIQSCSQCIRICYIYDTSFSLPLVRLWHYIMGHLDVVDRDRKSVV